MSYICKMLNQNVRDPQNENVFYIAKPKYNCGGTVLYFYISYNSVTLAL